MKQKSADISLIIPVYNNTQSIKLLFSSLNKLNIQPGYTLELIFVIDGSPDDSAAKIQQYKRLFSGQVKIISLAKNYGSLTAIRAGIDHADGKFILTKAADLQEPIELTQTMIKILTTNKADIVFGVRKSRQDPPVSTFFSNLFWFAYRHTVDKEVPSGGVDVIGFNHKVMPFIRNMNESRSSIIEYLFWLGLPKQFVSYNRKKRAHGKSGWTIGKKINYMLDSIFAFTDLPIVLLFIIGAISFATASLFALGVIIAKSTGSIIIPGYAATVTISLFFFGLNAVGLSIIGNYVWRIYENTKQRPHYVIKNIDR